MNPANYGPMVSVLLEGVPPAPLDAGSPQEKFRARLAALTPENIFAHTGKAVRDIKMARCCLAGLWLRHDFLDESHALSQEIETPTGSFWHAILHRREPDYGNARYWFRRTGMHPIFPELNEAALAIDRPVASHWDAYAFIDQVEKAMSTGAENTVRQLCVRVQQIEWELLFGYCWRHSVS